MASTSRINSPMPTSPQLSFGCLQPGVTTVDHTVIETVGAVHDGNNTNWDVQRHRKQKKTVSSGVFPQVSYGLRNNRNGRGGIGGPDTHG